MTPRIQLRLILSIAGLALALGLIGLVSLQRQALADVEVKTAVAYWSEEAPDRLDLDIRLRNRKDRDIAVVGVAAPGELAAQLCFGVSCDPGAVALAPRGELVLGAEGAAFVSLTSEGRPFREGEMTLIELQMEDGERIPVDLLVQRR